ncbi:MAG: undecaprenyl-diphosphate phosphatase [Magnetococcales bacterium]|nr:undecaprenyl-diphosphate phosphatase [Magnetococcales bacterium]MBF0322702.1 undecaprenyl-diphosphate phosphatase [Magnetococcales bacterium]
MEWLHGIILGLIQGVTELLPVSSSGHLILVPYFFQWQDQGLLFDMALNTATLLALIIYFRQDVFGLAQGWFRTLSGGGMADNPQGRMAWAIGLATIPAGVTGVLIKGYVEGSARDPRVVGSTLIFYGLLLWLADRRASLVRSLDTLTLREALLIGMAQTLALVPGTSRSGITITAALFLGFNREASARFAFFLAIPIGIAVGILDIKELLHEKIPLAAWLQIGVAFLAATLSALAVIHWLLGWLRRHNLTPFVVYRVLLGMVVFWLAF